MDDGTAIIIIGIIAFNYLVIYKKNQFLGNMIFTLTAATILMGETGETLEPQDMALGTIMFFGALANLIYSLIIQTSRKIK